jgi:hypothetical protein
MMHIGARQRPQKEAFAGPQFLELLLAPTNFQNSPQVYGRIAAAVYIRSTFCSSHQNDIKFLAPLVPLLRSEYPLTNSPPLLHC